MAKTTTLDAPVDETAQPGIGQVPEEEDLGYDEDELKKELKAAQTARLIPANDYNVELSTQTRYRPDGSTIAPVRWVVQETKNGPSPKVLVDATVLGPTSSGRHITVDAMYGISAKGNPYGADRLQEFCTALGLPPAHLYSQAKRFLRGEDEGMARANTSLAIRFENANVVFNAHVYHKEDSWLDKDNQTIRTATKAVISLRPYKDLGEAVSDESPF